MLLLKQIYHSLICSITALAGAGLRMLAKSMVEPLV